MSGLLHPLLKNRTSARLYHQDRLVDDASLLSILEAARWAPSSMNDQPWYFLVARRQDGADFEKMARCMGGNYDWAKTAGLLMAEVVSKNYHYEARPNRNGWHDMGLAVMSMAVQANALGMSCREMGGIDRPLTVKEYAVPDTHEVVCGLAFGYPVVDEAFKERLQRRQRRPLKDFVFEREWGKTSPVVSRAGETAS